MPSEASLTGRNSPGGNRLEQHRAALVASASEPVDRQVIELTTRLFESLLADSQLPVAFKPVIARMQIAVLRVVLADNAVLDSYDHPVWRLLDRIGEVSLGYSRLEDPRLSSFLSFASAVAEEMAGAAAPDTTLFRRGLNRIDVHLSEQLQSQLRRRKLRSMHCSFPSAARSCSSISASALPIRWCRYVRRRRSAASSPPPGPR